MLKRNLWIYLTVGIFLLTATAAMAVDKKSAVLTGLPDQGAAFLNSLADKPADLKAKQALDETKIEAAKKLAASLTDSQRQLMARALAAYASKTKALKKSQNDASLPSASDTAALKVAGEKLNAAAYKILNGEQLDLLEKSRPQEPVSLDSAGAPQKQEDSAAAPKKPESGSGTYGYGYYSYYYNYYSYYYMYYGYLYAYYAHVTYGYTETYRAYYAFYYAYDESYYAYLYSYYNYIGYSYAYSTYYYAYYAYYDSLIGSAYSALNYLLTGSGYSYNSYYYGGYLCFDYYTYYGYLYAYYHYNYGY